MHPSEIARLEIEHGYDKERQTPSIAPGTTGEAHALRLIDEARDAERSAHLETPAVRRRAAARYWRRNV